MGLTITPNMEISFSYRHLKRVAHLTLAQIHFEILHMPSVLVLINAFRLQGSANGYTSALHDRPQI